jgi:hypothetical protein
MLSGWSSISITSLMTTTCSIQPGFLAKIL